MQDLVLVPGLVCDGAVWAHQVEYLRDVARMTVPPVTAGITMAEMAAGVLAEAPPRFALAGFSMGGYVALEMLRQAPRRVTRLALLDTSARGDTAEKTAWRERVIALCEGGRYAQVIEDMLPILLHADRQRDPLADFVRAMAQRVGGATYVLRQRALMTRLDGRDLLRAADIPVRAIMGRQDAMSTHEAHAEIARLAPRGRFSVIEECGHMCVIERPHAATALLRDWLAD
ncbi:MAG: alpha/beta fold hydrolase [Burkholderiales bacterium]|nr:alpha/beta fold hydrolase [Burkholderiales bacterium]